MSLMDDDLFEPAYYSDEPALDDEPDYSDTPKPARLLPCPHRHLFGIPNGMSRKQLEEHSRKCVFLDGVAYTVYVYPDPCPDCGGEGVLDENTCPQDGIGSHYQCYHDCPSCGGRGWRLARDGWSYGDCPSCGGSGTRPTVTDSEVDAAISEAVRGQPVSPDEVNRERYRAILEAAARAREENRDD